MPLFTLLLTTGALFIRPAEISPALANFYPYETSILLTIVCSFHTLLPQFQSADLRRTPISATFLWYALILFVSHIGNQQFDEAFDFGVEMLKMMLYYFLMVGILDSKKAFISYVKWTTLLTGVCMFIAFLHLWRYITIVGQENLTTDVAPGQVIERMGGTGLLKDPNDLAVIAATFIPLSLYFALRKGTFIVWRLFWLWLIYFFFQAIQATASRGAIVAIGAAIIGVGFGKFGKKGLMVLPLLPLGLMLLPGRQGNLDLSSGTGQGRIQLQHEGFGNYVRHPILGVGPNHYHLHDSTGHVAHNSFLHAFTETGFPGGAVFASVYAIALLMLNKVQENGRRIVDPDLAEIRPYLIGMIMAQVAAKMSLSQNYSIPTFLFWGLVAVYGRICETEPPVDSWSKNPLPAIYFVVGVAASVFFFFYLNFLVRFAA